MLQSDPIRRFIFGSLVLVAMFVSPSASTAASETTARGPLIGNGAPKTVDRHVIRRVIEQAETRRIDIVGLGDSNQLFGGYGWQDAWSRSLADRMGMYATPLVGAGQNQCIGFSMNTVTHPALLPAGAPNQWLEFNDPDSGINETPYGYLDANATLRPGDSGGMRLRPGHYLWAFNNFDISAPLRFHFSYGTAPKGMGTTFMPEVNQALSLKVTHDLIDTEQGHYGIKRSWIDIPPGLRNQSDLQFQWFSDQGPVIRGPFFGLYMRAEDRSQDHGFSNHTLYYTGGASARQCAVELLGTSDAHLIEYFRGVRSLQQSPPVVLIRLAFGANDHNDDLPSIGPNAGIPSNKGEGVADNLTAIIDRVREVWDLANWDQSELTFLLVGNHPKPAETLGFGFRAAIATLAENLEGVGFVNLAALATPGEMFNGTMYDSGGAAHLTMYGYNVMTSRELAALIDLPEDLNGDCTVDSADLATLLGVFGQLPKRERGMAADLNFDGVIDSADLARMITTFGSDCQE